MRRPEIQDVDFNVLTYNVWLEANTQVEARMRAISDLVSVHNTHIVCFQECASNLTQLLQQFLPDFTFILQNKEAKLDISYYTVIAYRKMSREWTISPVFVKYTHFSNSRMGRGLLYARFSLEPAHSRTKVYINVGTSHLESPMAKTEVIRKQQLKLVGEILTKEHDEATLKSYFLGDLNWIPSLQHPMEGPEGWKDLWAEKFTTDGFTYDGRENPMIADSYRNRLDRILVLGSVEEMDIEIIGKDVLEGLTFEHQLKSGEVRKLPVLPSDHYGLRSKTIITC